MHIQKIQFTTIQRIKAIFVATHFLPCVLVTVMTSLLAYGAGQRRSILLLAPAVLFGQFCIGWSNDYIDRDRDRIAGRHEKPTVSGAVTAITLRNLAIISAVLSIGFSILYSQPATLVYLVAFGSAFWYNVRLKSSVLSIATFIVSFGLLPVYVGLGTAPHFIPAAWIIFAMIMWSIGIHIQNVIPDFEADAKTGIKGAANYLSPTQAVVITGMVLAVSAGAIGFGVRHGASVFVWVLLAVFGVIALQFVKHLLNKDELAAFKTSMLMTAVGSLLIMCAGPFMRS